MCGLAGFWAFRRHTGSEAAEDTIRRMTDTLTHRGPDTSGVWLDDVSGVALGHRRLAIVDLSPAGSQPMRSACGRYYIAYNGEIYNHLVLRTQLEQAGLAPQWQGQSDTETLLAAISAWGLVDALQKLNGMFAFALWDKEQKRLQLARDRFGEKPLYYGVLQGALVFGSELRALRSHPLWQADLDQQSIAHFLRYSSIPAPHSVYAGIQKLPAAHFINIDNPAEIRLPECYWQVDDLAQPTPGEIAEFDSTAGREKLVDSLHGMLGDIVNSRMMSDVPLGAFLSGGVDSSLVVALMQESSQTPVNTFCIGFEEKSHDESPFAKAVAAHLGTNHTEHIVSSAEALDVIPQLADIWDEPFADSSQIPTYLVSRLARQSVTVSLSGDGGDELFGGYRRYAKTLAIRSKLAQVPRPVRKLLGQGAELVLPEVAQFLVNRGGALHKLGKRFDHAVAMAELYSASSDDRLYDSMLALRSGPVSLLKHLSVENQRFNPGISPDIDFAQRMMQKDIKQYLSEVILTKVDRASMSVSLETRAPFLDPELAALALRLPWSVKQHDGVGKWPLITLLRRYLPSDLIDRPKMGFGVPIESWLRGPLLPWAEDLLAPDALASSGMLNQPAITRLWQQHKSGRFDWHHPLWHVLMLQMWLNKYH